MNKTKFALILCQILVLIILMTMLNVKKVNVVGLVVIFSVFSYYVWNDTINPLFGKVVMFVIAYVITVAAVGFFWNESIEVPEFRLNALLPKLNLSTNVEPNKTIINAKKMNLPVSDKYTYSFSVYIKEFTSATDPYIFFRNTSEMITDKNIGVKLAKDASGIFNTLYLDYCTELNTGTSKLATLPVGQWTTVIITVNGKYVNVYVGGNKLTLQLTIDNLKIPSKFEPIQFGNMPVYLANFDHSPSAIEPSPSFIEHLATTY